MSQAPRHFSPAMSAEMAISPAKHGPFDIISAGNDSTSVGLFLPAKSVVQPRISALPVTSTVTRRASPTARFARVTKRSSAASLSPATRLCR